MSPKAMPRGRAARSDPIREPARREPRTDNPSSSSAAALTLALSSGRRDSFSSKAKVVPDVMLLPSILGGFAPSSDPESAFAESSEPLSRWLMPFLGADGEVLPFTTRLGVAAFRLRCVKDSDILSIFEGAVVAFSACRDVLYCDDGPLAPAPFAMTGPTTAAVGRVIDGDA